MKKSMIGLDPLAWLSPGEDKSAAKKKNKKKASKKKTAKKKVTAKATTKKAVAKKKQTSKKKAAAKPAPKKSLSKKSASKKSMVTKEKVKNIKDNYVSPLGLDVQTLEQSFELLSPQAEQLVANFYDELFKQYPEVKPLFSNIDVEKQQEKLLSSLVLVIENVRKPDVLADALKNLGAKHQGYGARAEHYTAVGDTLIYVMQQMAEDAWTDTVDKAWRDALSVISDVMQSGYKDISEHVTQQPESEYVQSAEAGGKTVTDSIIKLNSVQDISMVADLHKQVGDMLKETDVAFDASDVERIDATTLQLLTCVFQQADKYGASVRWQSTSDAILHSAKLLGLQMELNL